MADPPRLLDEEEGADLARMMISSAQREAPRDAALQRTLTSLGIAGAALGATTAANAALEAAQAGALTQSATASSIAAAHGALTTGNVVSTGTGAAAGSGALGGGAGAASKALISAGVAKWVGATVASGAMAWGALHQLGAFEPRREVTQQVSTLPSNPMAQPSASNSTPEDRSADRDPKALASAEPAPEIEAPLERKVEPTVVASRKHVHQPNASRAKQGAQRHHEQSGVRSNDIGGRSLLAKEVAALDRAREALAGAQLNRALTEAQGYVTTFPKGHLLPEALFLKMEALERLGRLEAAKETASRLVSLTPRAPQAARARSIINAEQ